MEFFSVCRIQLKFTFCQSLKRQKTEVTFSCIRCLIGTRMLIMTKVSNNRQKNEFTILTKGNPLSITDYDQEESNTVPRKNVTKTRKNALACIY